MYVFAYVHLEKLMHYRTEKAYFFFFKNAYHSDFLLNTFGYMYVHISASQGIFKTLG